MRARTTAANSNEAESGKCSSSSKPYCLDFLCEVLSGARRGSQAKSGDQILQVDHQSPWCILRSLYLHQHSSRHTGASLSSPDLSPRLSSTPRPTQEHLHEQAVNRLKMERPATPAPLQIAHIPLADLEIDRSTQASCLSQKPHSKVRLVKVCTTPAAALSFRAGPAREQLWEAAIDYLKTRIAPYPHPVRL